jgi:excisionase family DNA binding protein
MLTVPEAARRARRNPETIRRWIRSGRLRAERVGTQHVIDERDLDELLEPSHMAPLPEAWKTTFWGEPMPDLLDVLDEVRRGR